MAQWGKVTRFNIPNANQSPGIKFKEAGEPKEFVIHNRGPGTLAFGATGDITLLTGQQLPPGHYWIESDCAHAGELFATADVANTSFTYKAKI